MMLTEQIDALRSSINSNVDGLVTEVNSLIDDIEATLARADLGVASHYDRLAGSDLRHYGTLVREEYERCRTLILEIKESVSLLDTDRTLQAAEAYRFHADSVSKTPERYRPETLRRGRSCLHRP